jgi:bacterioferritin
MGVAAIAITGNTPHSFTRQSPGYLLTALSLTSANTERLTAVSTQSTEANNKFELDVTKIRDDARKHMDAGAVTDGNVIDVERLICVLNEVIATEIVCYLRYSQHAIAATGIDRAQVAAEFTEHASEEMQHGLWAAERVSQLGGQPDFNPATLAERSHTEYVTVDESDLKRMLTENLVAERIVITSYQEIIRWIGGADPTTRRLMEKILEQEEEHADELNDLLGN